MRLQTYRTTQRLHRLTHRLSLHTTHSCTLELVTPIMPRERKQTPETLTLLYQCTDRTLSLADVY